MKIAAICSLVYTLVMAIFLTMQGYYLTRDIESVAHRAQVAADVPDMLEYMKQLRVGMESHNMTRGHTALIFKSPANDLSKLVGSIDQIITRLETVKGMSRSETTRQVALDDIRGTIRELEDPSLGYLWVQYWFFFLGFGIWIWPAWKLVAGDF